MNTLHICKISEVLSRRKYFDAQIGNSVDVDHIGRVARANEEDASIKKVTTVRFLFSCIGMSRYELRVSKWRVSVNKTGLTSGYYKSTRRVAIKRTAG